MVGFNSNFFIISFSDFGHGSVNAEFLISFFKKRLRQKYTIYDFIGPALRFLKNNNVCFGFKIIFSGRYSKRTRSKITIYKHGSLPLNTLGIPINYGFSNFTTKFGVCGIKIFFFYSELKFKSYFFRKKILNFLDFNCKLNGANLLSLEKRLYKGLFFVF